MRETVWRLDLKRVSLPLGYFQGWLARAETSRRPDDARELLNELVADAPLARLRLETELVEALFSEAAEECRNLRASLDELPRGVGRVAATPAVS